jgi:hypothetical protein
VPALSETYCTRLTIQGIVHYLVVFKRNSLSRWKLKLIVFTEIEVYKKVIETNMSSNVPPRSGERLLDGGACEEPDFSWGILNSKRWRGCERRSGRWLLK